jgi:hypothetical protein
VENARELIGARAAMAARFSPLECGESEREDRGASEEECGVVAPLKPSWPDWWGPGRRTVATARPCVDDGLWPFGHAALTD